MKFFKYHALGNDYVVIDPQDWPLPLTPNQIKVICHRNFGVGSDGILLGPLPSDQARFALLIFNPDGSVAEKSGNGLRIFSRYLWDRQRVKDEEFDIQTLGGMVRSRVLDDGKIVRVEMGQVSFQSDSIPVTGPPREVINEKIAAGGRTFTFCAATIGNPHCVIPLPEISAELVDQRAHAGRETFHRDWRWFFDFDDGPGRQSLGGNHFRRDLCGDHSGLIRRPGRVSAFERPLSETPSTKPQAPEKVQISISNPKNRCRGKRRAARFLSLELGASCELGV